MKSICEPEKCTMCGACLAACPINTIKAVRDSEKWFMQIEEDKCIRCGCCERTCPNIVDPVFQGRDQLYVGWSCDDTIRKNSASGGIASSLYSFALENNQYICGVELGEDYKARYIFTDDKTKILDFQNSKYTFSDMSGSYGLIFDALRKKKGVLFIGLPCQCAGLLNYLSTKNCSTELLTVADLVCHGTPYPELLPQHVSSIENKVGSRAGKIFFRDPADGTSNYAFTIYSESIVAESNIAKESQLYNKQVIDDDVYQIGFHGALIYRDCCYQCKYTRHERVGDLTLFDSGGLGKIRQFRGTKDNTSFILVNSEKGEALLQRAVENGLIHIEDRPKEEAYLFNCQLNRPCTGRSSQEREMLFSMMADGMNFDEAAEVAFQKRIRKNKVIKVLQIKKAKKILKTVIPNGIVDNISIYRNRKKYCLDK